MPRGWNAHWIAIFGARILGRVRVGVATIALLAWGACNPAFDLHETYLDVDAPVTTDEDGDFVDDSVDNCPGIYNPNQADGDGDHVGDACDPHPTTPGDHIALFEPFNSRVYQLTADSAANWMIQDGSIVTTGSPDATSTTLALNLMNPLSTPTLEVGFTVLGYSSAGQSSVLLTIAFPNPDAGNNGTCNVLASSPGDPLGEVVTEVNTNFQYKAPVPAIAVQAPQRVTATREASPTVFGKCTCAGAIVMFDPGPDATFVMTSASIAVQFAQVSLQYVVLYDVP